MTVRARATITAAPGGRLPVLSGEGPLAVRRTRPRERAAGTWAQVTTVGGMSGPLGGDRLRMSVTVEPGAALRVTSAASMVALPGPGRDGAEASYDTELTVGEGGVLHWWPEPLICAADSVLRMTTRVALAPGARLWLREQQILGRAGEPAGRLTTRLIVRHGGRPLLDQELSFGPGAPGWRSGAVLGSHRAVGQLLVVDPDLGKRPVEPELLGPTAVLTPLAGPGALVTALAPDGLELSRLLARGEDLITAGPQVG
ncbi:urease accessory protein UreD [Streptomyces xiamenensis]|uniref:urease accessory protein UreD n=1 Tax=Streptomyces xiamenensis TaxID=408015 RepID=UPI0036E68734